MTNEYFTASGNPATRATATSASMRAEFAAIVAGFDKLPTMSGNGGKLLVVNSGGTALTVSSAISESGGNITISGTTGLATGSTVNGSAIVNLVAAQTLTNKTLTNPTLNGFTGDTSVINIGSGQIYKDTSGNLGVGTSSPGSKLDVRGSTSTEVRSTSTSAGAGNYAAFRAVNGGGAASAFGSGTTAGAYSYTGEIANATFVGSFGNNPLQFVINSDAKAMLDTSGNLLVGTTTNSLVSGFASKVNIVYPGGAAQYGVALRPNTDVTTAMSFCKADGTAVVGTISQTASTTAYNTSSDYRLKENVQPMTGALAKVAALKPVTYTWKSDGSAGEGFIAHELAEVCPSAVTGEKDAVDAEGNPVYQGIDVSFLVGTLTAAIQEQQALISSQAAAIASLRARVANLEAA